MCVTNVHTHIWSSVLINVCGNLTKRHWWINDNLSKRDRGGSMVGSGNGVHIFYNISRPAPAATWQLIVVLDFSKNLSRLFEYNSTIFDFVLDAWNKFVDRKLLLSGWNDNSCSSNGSFFLVICCKNIVVLFARAKIEIKRPMTHNV